MKNQRIRGIRKFLIKKGSLLKLPFYFCEAHNKLPRRKSYEQEKSTIQLLGLQAFLYYNQEVALDF
jgi:hypothetical protein